MGKKKRMPGEESSQVKRQKRRQRESKSCKDRQQNSTVGKEIIAGQSEGARERPKKTEGYPWISVPHL